MQARCFFSNSPLRCFARTSVKEDDSRVRKGYQNEKWDRESESSESTDEKEADTDGDLEGPILDIELGEDYDEG